LSSFFRIDGDRGIGLDGRLGRDGAGDDLALHQKALDARVDQPGAELREIDDADGERSSPATLRKTMRRVRLEKLWVMKKLPDPPQPTDDPAEAVVAAPCLKLIGAIRLGLGLHRSRDVRPLPRLRLSSALGPWYRPGAMSAVRSSTLVCRVPGSDQPPALP